MFDNVHDMKFVLDYRVRSRANNDLHTLGLTKTGRYSYDVWLWTVPIIVTVDLTARRDPQELWIRDNCFEVVLQGPCWNNG